MAFDQKPRDFPLSMLTLDEINATTPPAAPKNGYRVLLASSGLEGAYQRHENQIATWQVNTWVFTPVENLPGMLFCFYNAASTKWEYFLHNGTSLLEFATEAYADDAIAAKVPAPPGDSVKQVLTGVSDGIAAPTYAWEPAADYENP